MKNIFCLKLPEAIANNINAGFHANFNVTILFLKLKTLSISSAETMAICLQVLVCLTTFDHYFKPKVLFPRSVTAIANQL